MASSLAWSISCVTGMPDTVVYDGSGTIVSPWPPSTIAWISSTDTPIASARNIR
jgi:hypothetical protein